MPFLSCYQFVVSPGWLAKLTRFSCDPLSPTDWLLNAWIAAMGILEKIAEIEKEISRTQKNKGNRRATGEQGC